MFTKEEKFLIGVILGDGNLHRRPKWKIDLTSIPVSERARILKERAIRRQECAATLKVDDIV